MGLLPMLEQAVRASTAASVKGVWIFMESSSKVWLGANKTVAYTVTDTLFTDVWAHWIQIFQNFLFLFLRPPFQSG